MSTGSANLPPRRPAPFWHVHGAILAAVGALALCFGVLLAIESDQTAPAGHAPARSLNVADIKPYIPWSPDAEAVAAAKAAPLREGPYTVTPDAPMLQSDGGFISLLGHGLNPKRFYVSHHSNAGGYQGGAWAEKNVVTGPDGFRLDVTPTGNPESPYDLAEVVLQGTYGYGRYEVIMRPAKGSGLVSAFFTYTGAYFHDPHDEIDIEFVGKETDVVQLNYFHNGKKGKYASIKLPFDASEADHLYAFDWKPEGISWYVDGKLIYQTAKDDPQIPRTSGRIYFSNWTGVPALRQWHGTPDFGDRGSAYYSCISFTPLGENTRRCADVFRPGTVFPAPAE